MALILLIDSLGKRYGMLPTEALMRANTFDLYIMDAVLTFENYQHKKAMNKGRDLVSEYSQDDLLNMLNKAKEFGNDNDGR
jgi:hypothetical protein